ncbi:MAG: hypothetical protein KA293_14090 [Bacteroidia bacterium]|nr:hypothetical protein [Bacteroidia bacterium]
MRVYSKGFFLAALLLSMSTALSAQSVFYSVNFNNGCTANCLANTYAGWTVLNNDGGVSGGSPNDWFVSCAEEGIVPPGCGSTCIGDASLHIGADPGAGGDNGATFNETGITNATFKTAVSPTISTVGYSSNTLSFDFIAFGSAACSDDRAQLRLSTDNGATWPVGFQYCLTSVCCGACNGYSQGQWTTYTLALPAAFNNNPNVRVGFNWRNNGNGSGTDPSVAIDDVRISTIIVPAQLVTFAAREEANLIRLSWTSAEELKLDRYEVERSLQPTGFKTIGTVSAKGNGSLGNVNYSYNDPKSGASTVYYRLKMVDQDGKTQFSNIVRIVEGSTIPLELVSITPDDNAAYNVNLWSVADLVVQMEVHDLQGRRVLSLPDQHVVAGENKLHLDMSEKSTGAYLLNVKLHKAPKGYQAMNLTRKFVVAR